MNKILLALVLTLTNPIAMADWTPVGQNDNDDFTLYVDLATVRKAGNRIKMWHLQDYKTAQISDAKKYMSSKARFEYDCEEVQMRLLAFSLFANNAGLGQVVHWESDPSKWLEIPPQSTGQTLWMIACKKIQ